MNKEKIREILIAYLKILVGFGLVYFVMCMFNNYCPTVIIKYFLESIKTFMIPILSVVIVKIQLDINFSNLELNQKKFIFEQKDKIEQFKKNITKDIDSILVYNSLYERIYNEVKVSEDDKVEPKITDKIIEFQYNIKKNQDIIIYYYEVIQDKESIALLVSVKDKITQAELMFSKLKIEHEEYIQLIQSQIDFQNKNDFKYKKEIIDLYQKEIEETPHWEDFKALLVEIKDTINKLN